MFPNFVLSQEVMTEEKLAAMMAVHAKGNKKGVPYEGFDRLVDELVELYQRSDIEDAAEEDDVDSECRFEFAFAPSAVVVTCAESSPGCCTVRVDENSRGNAAAMAGGEPAEDELDHSDYDGDDSELDTAHGHDTDESEGEEGAEEGAEEDGEEDYVEVDTVQEFERLSAGRGYVDVEVNTYLHVVSYDVP
jgi:hypothetical protein